MKHFCSFDQENKVFGRWKKPDGVLTAGNGVYEITEEQYNNYLFLILDGDIVKYDTSFRDEKLSSLREVNRIIYDYR